MPAHLRKSLYEWLKGTVKDQHLGGFLRDLEARRQEAIHWDIVDWMTLERIMLNQASSDPDLALDALDFALAEYASEDAAADLAGILHVGGSAWMVSSDGASLHRRVLPEAVTALESALAAAPGSRAADHLQKAWASAYGRHPDPGGAYREAVKAVEAILCPALLPNDPKATLGKAIAALKDAPQKLAHVFRRGEPGQATVGLLDMLWTNQTDRHGSADGPVSATQQEAETAVQLAVLLIQWLSGGAVRIVAGKRTSAKKA
jgi:hypothetical protein